MIEQIKNIPNISVIRLTASKFKFYGMKPKQYTKFRKILVNNGCEIIHHTAHRNNNGEIIDIIEIL